MAIDNPQCPLCERFMCEYLDDTEEVIICYNPSCTNCGNKIRIRNIKNE